MRFALLTLLLTSLALAETRIGADANYAPTLEDNGAVWRVPGSPRVEGEPPPGIFEILRAAGFDSFRLRLWTKDEGRHGLDDAIATARRAQAAGLKPYGVMFLSEDWADYIKQPAPAEWQKLSLDEKAAAVEKYAERVARRFKEAGVDIDTWEIGNEIDFGIAGEFETQWHLRFNLDHMRQNVWPRAARIINAAQRGVLKVSPEAKFMLHVTQWWNPEFSIAFFQAMRQHKVTIDQFGLSFFPTSNLAKENSLDYFQQQVRKLHDAIQTPIVICEFAYPSEPKFDGQFAEWNQPVPGYELSPDGQAKWVADFLKLARKDERIVAVFYWSPEWYGRGMWWAFALFDEHGLAKPALGAIR